MIKKMYTKIKLSIYYRVKTRINEYMRNRDLAVLFDALKIRSNNGSLIVIGSNSGQEVTFYKRYFKTIHLIDPLISSIKMHRACYDKSVHLHSIAISSEPGDKTFYLASNGGESSSLSKPTLHLEEYPRISFQMTSVKAIRLGDLEFINQAICLIIDVQGHEIDVLRSAENEVFLNLSIVVCEYSLVPLYEGSGVLNDLIGLMRAKGFSLAFTTSPYISRTECTGDAVFIKDELIN